MESALTYSDFPFLKELGIEEMNLGCYHSGKWCANGPEFTSKNPHNNKAVCKIKMASVEDYEDCVKAMEAEKAKWMTTPGPLRGEIVR
jgi:acyl-CoA reductase-like NAD-dependent aldehyde dehydrogenase